MNDKNTASSPDTPPAARPASPEKPAPSRLKRLRVPIMLVGTAVIIAGAAYYFLFQGRYVSTDDAYVNAARISISTNVPGRVVELKVHDNQRVRRGQLLFRLDDRPYRIAVEEARAKLDAARLQIESLKATRMQKISELRSAQNTLEYQQREAKRQQRLSTSGISSQSQVDRVLNARDAAQQSVAAAKQEIASITAKLDGDPSIDPAKHPLVEQAQAELDRAELNLSYTAIKAPDDGIVAQVEKLQAGDYVEKASPVFALLAIHDSWIDANFKEVQLAKMRAGQPATVEIDAYGDKVFKAHVASFTPGTGAQFSILPAQNATGNWVKVVQRLAVRIELDNPDPARPLYAGLSATVKVDTGDQSGPPLTGAAPVTSESPADEPVSNERTASRNESP
ncbi:MAG TPA: HlyD family secretion protein [Gammaproteobacteria bacterium]|nr:HlyD family secretion protein [Gammaproteobacteria bacterium]